ncbi:hypothetical protein GCM10011416_18480 [Polaribacter pacificus]|uniref:DoxX-like family protein n=1 Tax=Polaribacter pacificus TaxID=1775173 RepID=A0A917HZI0_9FLAO|nr:DoxX family protein [Polaribacter pacificus]GGH00314.1 hypothetical protein GCM10011416_18480 [Polaribacter pacificus]
MNKFTVFALKIVIAIILLQTLFFKFTGAQESIDLFTKIAGNNEVFMRIGTGVLELIASFLLFAPKKALLGGLLTVGLMTGAILSHLAIIGIVHNNDHGALFISALIALSAASLLVYNKRKELSSLLKKQDRI